MGVLVDNVLGYALMLDRPVGQWSVSSEISADLRRPVPADGSVLLAEARPFHCGSSPAFRRCEPGIVPVSVLWPA